ncbi:MAG TPA: aldehyde dehydrogenase [Firmicutes bacterium]|nr:aldehyde dehydrogenase [Bacillota bacterium]
MNQYEDLLLSQKKYRKDQGGIRLEQRIEALKRLKLNIKKYEQEIVVALQKDLGKSEFEAYTTEIGFIYSTISHTLKHIKKWAKVRSVKNDMAQLPGKSSIYPSAYGAVLIIGPYNYPFQLLIEPLIGAIAGGNTAVIKPSEYTPNIEQVVKKIITETFDERYVAVVLGDYLVNSALLDLNFDYIFFTGSVNVGKIVMEKASQYLTPVTLELGGKSPVIVESSAKLDLAVKRIAWGKFSNCGQTCVAPDYILVHEHIHDEFIEKMKQEIVQFYGTDIEKNKDYGRIVNQRHMQRLANILKVDEAKIVFGGDVLMDERYISPTILANVTAEDEVMKDELFGPLMPVIKYSTQADIDRYLTKYENPLALYVFTENKKYAEEIMQRYSFGGGCINDTITHVASAYLPFGGVGNSGMGRYHGHYSFKTFTYEKAVVKKSTKFDLKLVYPPYENRLSWVKKLMK